MDAGRSLRMGVVAPFGDGLRVPDNMRTEPTVSRRVRSTRWLILLLPLMPAAWLVAFFATSAWGFSFPPPDDYVEGVPICGRPLTVDLTDGRTFPVESTRVMLALDEQWCDRFGDRADDVARSLLADAAILRV